MQLTRDGNWRQRVRKAVPAGLVAKTMCRWWRALWMKASQAAALPGRISGCVASHGCSWSSNKACSSGVNNPASHEAVVVRRKPSKLLHLGHEQLCSHTQQDAV